MSKQRSLSVADPVFAEFNRLKIRLAVSGNNMIPTTGAIIAALLTIGNAHYDELLSALTPETETET